MWSDDGEADKLKAIFSHQQLFELEFRIEMWFSTFKHFSLWIIMIICFLHWNKAALRLDEGSHKIDKDIHDSSEVSDDSCWGEEKTIGHDLQVELNAHEDHEHILPNLKHKAQV